jgi:hypothetical protein
MSCACAASFGHGASFPAPENVLSPSLLPPHMQHQQQQQQPSEAATGATSMAQTVADISQGLQLMQEATGNGALDWPFQQARKSSDAVRLTCPSPASTPTPTLK